MARAKGKRNRRKEKLEFVQDYLPIRDLKNGIIETTDDRYIKILEIEPINFTLRSDEEQFNIISSFASWLKISPMRLQFKSITRRADSDKHISMICEELEHEENPQCKELGEDYIGLIKDVGNREALTRRFFLIFQYEAVGRNESDDYAKIYGMLQTAEQTARAYFMQCGNSIIQSKDPDEATAEILYMFYNRRSCTDEPFSSRVDRIVVDTMAAKKKIIGMDPVPPIRMANFLASRGIDLSHYNYVVMDGLYYSFLYIKAGGYPSRVRAGWMSSLINAGEGVDIDVHLRRENRSRTIDKVAQRIRLNRTKLKSMQDTSTDYEELTNSIQAGYFIKNGIANYKPDQRTILAVWVLLRFIDYVDPMAHYPAVYPSQIFFLKENTGYEIVVLYDGEQHLSKLLQPQDDEMKYIFVLPNIAMASQMMRPKAPCLFATVNFAGQEEPDITFYTEEAATDGLDKLVHSSAG